jgi:Beta-fructosidases (levanase/invertase)
VSTPSLTPDHHRPQYHLRLHRGYLNDPNGPVRLGGITHLYFQSRLVADKSVPVEWGHATSTDLARWTLHRPAMSPLPEGLDGDGCWSGNTVSDGDEIHAFYSGFRASEPLQSALTAVSTDGGATFGAPLRVIDDPAVGEGVRMFRDPFVFADGDHWTMVLGSANSDGTAAIREYRSPDRRTWTYVGRLAELPWSTFDGVDTGEAWECPQILPVGGREVALVCSWSFDGGIGRVLAFPLDRQPAPRPVDDGTNFYAASVMREGSDRPLVWGWITEGRDEQWWTEAGWAGAISLPRVAWLDRGDRLCSHPHPAVESLRIGVARSADTTQIGPRAEIVAPARSGRVRIRFGDTEWCEVRVDHAAGTVAFDRTHASADPRADGGTAVATDAFDEGSDRPGVRIFIDGSVVEIFTQSGRSLTSRVYPLATPAWTVESDFAGDQDAVVWDIATAVHSESVR